MIASAHRMRKSRRASNRGAPSWLIFTKPLMATLLGTRGAADLIASGIASGGQAKPARKKNGRPIAANASCTPSGVRKTAATTRPNALTASTKGSANSMISAGEAQPRQTVEIGKDDEIERYHDRFEQNIGEELSGHDGEWACGSRFTFARAKSPASGRAEQSDAYQQRLLHQQHEGRGQHIGGVAALRIEQRD